MGKNIGLFLLVATILTATHAHAFTFFCADWGATLSVGGPNIKVIAADGAVRAESVGVPRLEGRFYAYTFEKWIADDASEYQSVKLLFPKLLLEGKKSKGLMKVVDQDDNVLYSAECVDTSDQG